MAAEDRKKLAEETRELNALLEQQKTLALALGNLDQARAAQSQITANNEKLAAEYKKDINDLSREELNQLNQIERKQRDINAATKEEVERRTTLVKHVKFLNEQLKIGWKYLQESDKVIRQTILNLGMSGTKAALMRDSFEQSAGFVTRLGGSLEDIQSIMTGYADETGRARVMSEQMVKDITAIGKGTGLGIEQATRLGAQFELMGFDAKSTMDYVQGVVDTSERMGVNTTKVLKNVNDNFKRLNTYTFQQGVKGFAQMAMYAEKFRIDINQALNAADVARSLEGAIDLAANLQVMGGEFAKTDPFEMLFLSRNDPAKFTEKIADMTKGVVSFRKMADGSFEKFISPADRDRLAAVAKSLGMEAGELTQIAERQAEIGRMRQQMAGMGLSSKERELIEGAAIFNKETGRFEVQIAGHMQDVAKLTSTQANAFAKERVSLEERAKQAMTFDDTFKATINSLKSALLPILHSVNGLLTKLQPIADWMSKFAGSSGGWIKAGAVLLGAASAWKMASLLFNKGVDNWMKSGSIMAKQKTEPTSVMGKFLRGTASATPEGGGTTAGAGSKISGKALAGAGAGVGLAAAGIGAGIGAAAAGISLLANAMSGLDEKQAEVLKDIVKTLGWTIGIGVGVAAAIMAISVAAGASAGPLMAFGVAVALIGAGIGIAAAGIGVMGMGLAKLVESSKGAGKDMPMVAMGIAGISAAMMGAGLALPGAIGMMTTVKSIGKHASALATVGDSLKTIKAVLTGSKEDFIAVQQAVESISKANVRGGGMFADIANLLSKPLKVEFAQGKVAMVNDITLTIDGQKFMQKAYNVQLAVQKHDAVRSGKGDVA
jgi:hypothetical protein